MDEKIELIDASGNKRYFTIIPRVVWAKCRNPYDLSMWITVADIAGQVGECYLGIGDLARLSMMSKTQAQESREYLLKCGLLVGEKRRDAGHPFVTWHIQVPDLWKENLKWSTDNLKIKDRLTWKTIQKDLLED